MVFVFVSWLQESVKEICDVVVVKFNLIFFFVQYILAALNYVELMLGDVVVVFVVTG